MRAVAKNAVCSVVCVSVCWAQPRELCKNG